jgi:hypothetical protein
MGICVYCGNDTGEYYNVCKNCIPHDMEVGKENRYNDWCKRVQEVAKTAGVTEELVIQVLNFLEFPLEPGLNELRSCSGYTDFTARRAKELGIYHGH